MGSVHIIVTQKRSPYHHEKDFTKLGLKVLDSMPGPAMAIRGRCLTRAIVCAMARGSATHKSSKKRTGFIY